MSTQALLTIALISVVVIFAIAFTLDLAATIRKAWNSAKPEVKPQPEITPQETKIASLDWVQERPEETELEAINIIELAKQKAPQPQFKPVITTLPQTEEAKQFEQWLNKKPEYSSLAGMTVKKLRQEAKIWCVRNAGSMTKKEIISAILAA